MHNHEEIRAVALDILSGREPGGDAGQYETLSQAIGVVFARRENCIQPGHFGANYPLAQADKELFLDVFWELFRQGIITLGMDSANKNFPFFRLTRQGREIARGNGVYFFHDVSSYEAAIRHAVPNIHEATLLYAKEAMQAFYAGCILSATVMLGAAAEHTFVLLLETLEQSSQHRATFVSVFKQGSLFRKISQFRRILEQQVSVLPPDILEDLGTRFLGIQSIIRESRNESGHPTGKIPNREQTFVLMQLFIPFAKKLYQLMDFYSR